MSKTRTLNERVEALEYHALLTSTQVMSDFSSGIRRNEVEIGLLRRDFDAFRAEVYERFDAVDRRFDAVDRRFDGLEQSVNSRFAKVDRNLELIMAHLGVLPES